MPVGLHNYSVAPILSGTMIYKLRTGLLVAAAFSVAQVFSVLIHGLPASSLSESIALLSGEILAYFVIAFFGNYIASLVEALLAERKTTKAQAKRQAIIEERQRIAREMHDNLAQILAGIKFRGEALRDTAANTHMANDIGTMLV